jgi:hypothetical protein
VTDASGAAIAGAVVEVSNPITTFKQSTQTDATGTFRIIGVPPNTYHVKVSAPGFDDFQQDVAVRTAVPINLKVPMTVSGGTTSVTVEGDNDVLENVPYQHNDVDQAMMSKLPNSTPGGGLSDAITLASPGVVADSNGLFHPLGDHGQTSYYVDGQPILDQQSKQFSTQIPLNALQSMELITGSPAAEFGNKTSMVVNAQTRSGLGQKPFGSFTAQYGSFGTVSEESSYGFGSAKFGNFLVANVLRSGRFLDSPEFFPMHDIGTNATFLDRVDFQPTGQDAFHVTLFGARNWFQVPNTYDQPGQDQRQRVLTWNIAPGYQHTFSPKLLLTINPFIRQDQLSYYPSRDVSLDMPATLAQDRRLTNYGVRADLSYVAGVNNIKIGTQIMQTRLRENFSLAVTDPTFNPVCVDAGGNPQALPNVTDPSRCAGAGFIANPDLQRGLVPFDLTRGGGFFSFSGKANINEYAVYIQDAITLGHLSLTPGFRIDRYDGLAQDTGIEPRMGLSYNFKKTNTVIRAAYSRTFETPYNENLVISSATGIGGLATNVFGAFGAQPLRPGNRNQYNAGLQQSLGKFLLLDVDYFNKHTRNAYDFDTLFNTPVHFPIAWRKSKLDGVSARLSTPNIKGFQAFTTVGHTRARFFGPEVGGLIFNSPVNASVFRIDHDEAFEETTHVRYQRGKDGPWAAVTWRYDSGAVAGAVETLQDALALTAAQQAAIGFHCGNQFATITTPIESCAGSYGATRLQIPAPGTSDPDHNPPRIAPRHLFDIAAGTDNLFHTEKYRTTLRLTVLNVTNNVALYNFLSTFSGTHFVAPRSYEAEIGFVF